MLQIVKGKIGLFLLFVLMVAISRLPGVLSSDLASFSGTYALVFCAGVYLSGRGAWWMPLGAMVISDIALNMFYSASGWAVWEPSKIGYQMVSYAAYAVIIWLGRRFKPQTPFLGLLGGGVLGALLFYIITNTASWLINPFRNSEYTLNFLGWLIALTKGAGDWPGTWQFFRNTLLSGGLFTALLVGAMKFIASAESPQEKEAGVRAEEPEGEKEPEEAKA
jgi:hypothetical protein